MNIETHQKLLLTIKEFCWLCNIGETKYHEEVNAERITPIPIGSRGIRLHRDEVAKWIERRLAESGRAKQ
jgi:predicted DNA-binding transcriptional regulator AlpA